MKYFAYHMTDFCQGSINVCDVAAGRKTIYEVFKINDTHKFVHMIEAERLEEAFMKGQGDYWSPNGEARSLIRGLGLEHTSLSVGDVLIDEEGNQRLIMLSGFEEF